MYRVTTPTHTLTLPINTSDCAIIQVAYQQGETKLMKVYDDGIVPDGMTLDGKKVIVRLTQAETKAFKKGKVSLQVRVLTNGGDAYASEKFAVAVLDVINEDILV